VSGLTGFQEEVARAFFSLDASRDFVLSGGAALIAHDMVIRSTGDLDLFSTTGRPLADVVTAFVDEAATRGWPVHVVRRSATFARIEVGDMNRDGLVVDLGVDSEPVLQITASAVGPTFQPIELAARKLLALFGRAEARDFSDLFELSSLFDLDELSDLAGRIDAGFNRAALAEALGSVDRFADADFRRAPQPRARFASLRTSEERRWSRRTDRCGASWPLEFSVMLGAERWERDEQ
jgi:hypothetical protein